MNKIWLITGVFVLTFSSSTCTFAYIPREPTTVKRLAAWMISVIPGGISRREWLQICWAVDDCQKVTLEPILFCDCMSKKVKWIPDIIGWCYTKSGGY